MAYYAIRVVLEMIPPAYYFVYSKGIQSNISYNSSVVIPGYVCACFYFTSLFSLQGSDAVIGFQVGEVGSKIGKWRLGLGCKVVPATVKDWNWDMHLILIAAGRSGGAAHALLTLLWSRVPASTAILER